MKFLNSEKGISSVLILLAALGLILFLGITLTVPFKDGLFGALYPKNDSFASGPISSGSKLLLKSSQMVLSKGCNYSMEIYVDTGNFEIDGIDALIDFNPQLFMVNSIVSAESAFGDHIISYDNDRGKIVVSALSKAPPAAGIIGLEKVAIINFMVKNSNLSQSVGDFTFDFDPQYPTMTTNSNVIERGTIIDRLVLVENAYFSLSEGVCGVIFIPGDINQNGRVDVFDFNLLITDFGKSSGASLESDINKNGRVDVFDFNLLIENFGKSN